jgi:hypothetical protein
MLKYEYLDLTLRDVLALARGTAPERGTPVPLEELGAALDQLVRRLALQDSAGEREQRAWLADQLDITEAVDADS